MRLTGTTFGLFLTRSALPRRRPGVMRLSLLHAHARCLGGAGPSAPPERAEVPRRREITLRPLTRACLPIRRRGAQQWGGRLWCTRADDGEAAGSERKPEGANVISARLLNRSNWERDRQHSNWKAACQTSRF